MPNSRAGITFTMNGTDMSSSQGSKNANVRKSEMKIIPKEPKPWATAQRTTTRRSAGATSSPRAARPSPTPWRR